MSGRPHFGNTGHRRLATEWPERKAPFYKVATIHIPRQAFDMQERNAFCEKLFLNPWHALPGHRPLGITNRLRKVIDERIDQIRREPRMPARSTEQRWTIGCRQRSGLWSASKARPTT